jgi:hypothetical protein
MPGIAAPYLANDPRGFARFDSDIQFFSSFAFGYDTVVSWFAAEEISRGFFFLATTAARGRALANLGQPSRGNLIGAFLVDGVTAYDDGPDGPEERRQQCN